MITDLCELTCWSEYPFQCWIRTDHVLKQCNRMRACAAFQSQDYWRVCFNKSFTTFPFTLCCDRKPNSIIKKGSTITLWPNRLLASIRIAKKLRSSYHSDAWAVVIASNHRTQSRESASTILQYLSFTIISLFSLSDESEITVRYEQRLKICFRIS